MFYFLILQKEYVLGQWHFTRFKILQSIGAFTLFAVPGNNLNIIMGKMFKERNCVQCSKLVLKRLNGWFSIVFS